MAMSDLQEDTSGLGAPTGFPSCSADLQAGTALHRAERSEWKAYDALAMAFRSFRIPLDDDLL